MQIASYRASFPGRWIFGSPLDSFSFPWHTLRNRLRKRLQDMRLAALINPLLTTVAQCRYGMGVVAMTMLLVHMGSLEGPAHRQVLETSLVTRGSPAPARGE